MPTGRNRGTFGLALIGVGAAVCLALWLNKASASPLLTSGTVQMVSGKRYRLVFKHTKEAGAAYRSTLMESGSKHPEMELVLELPSETLTVAEAVAGQPDSVEIGSEVAPGIVLQSIQEVL